MDTEVSSARQVRKDGIWFKDEQGRYLLFRGVNFASRSKLPPYLPVFPLNNKTANLDVLNKELAEVSPELEMLKHLGFNVIRFLVIWKAIEPIPNPNLDALLPQGEEYLGLVKEILDALYSRGLYAIIDFHQDIAHEIYGGDGFPDWALAIDEGHLRPIKSERINPTWFLGYNFDPLVKKTLNSFWKNQLRNTEEGLDNYPVRTHLEKTIGQVVKFFKNLNNGQGHPGILGYQLFNEPHQVGLDSRKFEEQYLIDFYNNTLGEIKKFDRNVFVFIEPRVEWNVFPDFEIVSHYLNAIKNMTHVDRLESSDLTGELLRNNKDIDFSKIRNSILEQIRSGESTSVSKLGNELDSLLSMSSNIVTYLPKVLSQFDSSGVFSFHYYDPWTLLYSLLKLPDSMHNKQREWPKLFNQMRESAISRNLVPFLTEFGGNQDWETLKTDLPPAAVYNGSQIRAYMNLQFVQIETFLLHSTYWNYDLYNTREGKDNWNLENFSLLGPNRTPRNLDIAARPYPIRSSAEPKLLFFDIETKHCVVILKGPVVDAPTIIFIPYKRHFTPKFEVWSTSDRVEWNKENQLLNWYPDQNVSLNQVIIVPEQKLDKSILPEESRILLERTRLTVSFGE